MLDNKLAIKRGSKYIWAAARFVLKKTFLDIYISTTEKEKILAPLFTLILARTNLRDFRDLKKKYEM